MHYDFGSVGAVCSIRESYGPQNQRVQKVCASTALTNSLDEKKKLFNFLLVEFVPGFLLLLLSRDKGTAGKENSFIPGQRHIPSNGNPNVQQFSIIQYQ